MALFRKEHIVGASDSPLDTLVGAGASLQGILKSDGNIRIDGMLEGSIETTGNVVIGPSARVVADITANAVQVWGHVQGNIYADGRLEILSTGRVFGELRVSALMIDEGGIFQGQCYMNGQDIELLEPLEDRLLPASAEETEGEPRESDSEPNKPSNDRADLGDA